MTWKFVSYIGSKPKGTAAIILTLAVALVLVSAGLALALSHFGRAPYPSQKVSLKLVNDEVIYTQDSGTVFENETPAQSFPYTGMKILLQVAYSNGYNRMGATDFGNQTRLSGSSNATVHQVLMTSSSGNVSIDITDSTGDGSFDYGDTIVFEIVPLGEGIVYTMGLLWNNLEHGGSMAMEVSFAVHDGKLYGWFSHVLNDTPWYEPYTHQGNVTSV